MKVLVEKMEGFHSPLLLLCTQGPSEQRAHYGNSYWTQLRKTETLSFVASLTSSVHPQEIYEPKFSSFGSEHLLCHHAQD